MTDRDGPILRRARRAPPRLAVAATLLVATAALLALLRGHGEVWDDAFVMDARGCTVAFRPHLRLEARKRDTPLRTTLATDAHGFRVPQEAAAGAGDASRCRVIVVGDSFAEGTYVPAEAATPAQLERLLRARGYAVAVHNGGVRGTTLPHGRANLFGPWRDLSLTAVVALQSANDLDDLLR